MDRQKRLNDALDYDSESGALCWRERSIEQFSTKAEWLRWNKRYAGRIVRGTAHGYLRLRIDDKIQYAHRIIWEMHNGSIPEGFEIDHINRDTEDNRLANLRLVSIAGNRRNTKRLLTRKVLLRFWKQE